MCAIRDGGILVEKLEWLRRYGELQKLCDKINQFIKRLNINKEQTCTCRYKPLSIIYITIIYIQHYHSVVICH